MLNDMETIKPRAQRKHRVIHTLGLFLLLTCSLTSYTQVLNEAQRAIVEQKVKALINDYALYSQFTKDGTKLEEEYIKAFSALFNVNAKTSIVNDLSVSDSRPFPSPVDYIMYVRQNYRLGLDVTIKPENVRIQEIEYKKGVYNIYTSVTKRIIGIHNNQMHKYNGLLNFVLTALPDSVDAIRDLKINRITSHRAYVNYAQNKQRRGILVGVNGAYALTQFNVKNIEKYHMWNTSLGKQLIPGIDITFMLNRGFALGTGVRLTKVTTDFSISGYSSTVRSTLTDIDGDTYNPVLDIPELLDSRSVNGVDIPFLLKFYMGRGKTRLTLDMGVIGSFYSSAAYRVTGTAVRSGYYPQYSITLKNIPEYDFGTYSYTGTKNKIETIPTFGISGYAAIGLQFEIKRYILLSVKSGLSYGLTKFDFSTPGTENYFYYTLSNQANNVTIQSAGVEMGLIFKIL